MLTHDIADQQNAGLHFFNIDDGVPCGWCKSFVSETHGRSQDINVKLGVQDIRIVGLLKVVQDFRRQQ